MATVVVGCVCAEYHGQRNMYNASLQPKGDLLPKAIFIGC